MDVVILALLVPRRSVGSFLNLFLFVLFPPAI